MKLVIPGGIYGFSTKIIYLLCTTNNKSQTVHHELNAVVEKRGYPHEYVVMWELKTLMLHDTYLPIVKGDMVVAVSLTEKCT